MWGAGGGGGYRISERRGGGSRSKTWHMCMRVRKVFFPLYEVRGSPKGRGGGGVFLTPKTPPHPLSLSPTLEGVGEVANSYQETYAARFSI